MASSRILAVLLAGFALSALAASPCGTVAPAVEAPCTPVKAGLTQAQIAGITVGTLAAGGAIAAGTVEAFKANKGEEEVPKVNARGSGAAEVTEAPIVAPTTTAAPSALDSSASSGASTEGSSASLDSVGSGPADSSSSASASEVGLFNMGSSASDSSDSATSSGSTASGSWGSQLQIWQWLLVLALLCCCLAGGGAAGMGGKKTKKKAKKSKAAAAPAPVAEVEPLMAEIPPLMPLQAFGTQSLLQPSYSMVAPATTAYQYAPQVEYVQQPVQYAQAAPMQYAAAPMQYAAAPVQYAAAPQMQYAAVAPTYAAAAPTMMMEQVAGTGMAWEATAQPF